MFSALSQGSPIYLLDKTSTPEYKVGEVIGVSTPRFNSFGNTVDLKIKVDDSVQEFSGIPSINSFVSYNNGKVIISETKQSI
jgi:co-chaperonin GroES (HSP10)